MTTLQLIGSSDWISPVIRNQYLISKGPWDMEGADTVAVTASTYCEEYPHMSLHSSSLGNLLARHVDECESIVGYLGNL